VIGIDRTPKGGRPLYQLVIGDVTDDVFLKGFLHSHRFDVIFHLAGRGAFAEPAELYKANVVGTATLLDAIRYLDRPELKVVLFGSSAQ